MSETGRIKRKWMAHYINTSTSGTAAYSRLGKDLEEYTIELNPNVETKKNIFGENTVTVDSYEPSASIEPYYAVIGEPLFERLQKIADERQTLDDLVTDTLEVHLWEEPTSGAYVAYREEGIIALSSYGGDTAGYQLPFTVHSTGNRQKGTFNITTKTFTPSVTL